MIDELTAELQKMPQVDCPIVNHFAPGIYAREMTIPAGVVLTGAVHKTEHLNIISAGRIVVAGNGTRTEIVAPCTFVSKPGTQRAGYALETTVWTTIHATEETDIDKLVALLTESTNAQLLGGAENLQLMANQLKVED